MTERELMEARRALICSAEWVREKFAITRSMSVEERMRLGEATCRASEELASRVPEARRERARAVFNRLAPGAEESLRKLSRMRWPGPPPRR